MPSLVDDFYVLAEEVYEEVVDVLLMCAGEEVVDVLLKL
jgi:hypothetical protein